MGVSSNLLSQLGPSCPVGTILVGCVLTLADFVCWKIVPCLVVACSSLSVAPGGMGSFLGDNFGLGGSQAAFARYGSAVTMQCPLPHTHVSVVGCCDIQTELLSALTSAK